FLPVKTTNDLLLLRSAVSDLTEDYRLRAPVAPPLVTLSKPYKTIGAFDARFPAGAPALRSAPALPVEGDWPFGGGVPGVGVAALPDRAEPARVPDGARVTAEGVSG